MMPLERDNFLSEKITSLSSRARRSRRRRAWVIASDLPASFRYASQGIVYAFWSQRNFRIHLFIGALVFGLGIYLRLDLNHLAILALTVTAILALELLNTAIEATVDLAIGRRFHPLARIAKDCSAAAVLLASIGSVIIAFLLLLPPLLTQLGI
jgi:diacylglycerol kinase (ATP)